MCMYIMYVHKYFETMSCDDKIVNVLMCACVFVTIIIICAINKRVNVLMCSVSVVA